MFRHGCIHADPNPGNYRFVRSSNGPRIVVYDYGNVATLDPMHRVALLKLIQITMERAGSPFKPLVALGSSEPLLAPLRGKLAAVCSVLFEPFACPGKFDLSWWRRSERVEQILNDDRWNFRLAAPARLIFVMRAFTGLIYYLERLESNVAWSIALRPHLDEHQPALAAFDASAPARREGSFEAVARHLRIRVTENGRQKVALTFMGRMVDSLDDLMDADLTRRIKEQGIDLAAIVRNVRQTAYAPQELFCLPEQPTAKGVCVWLE